jgi:hypothetical protein
MSLATTPEHSCNMNIKTNATLICNYVSAIKPFESFGDVDHTIKELMSL